MRLRALAVSLLSLGCSSTAPPIVPDEIPSFDSAFVCRATTGVRPVLPDRIDIQRDCIAIDALAFRELILAGVPAEDWGPFWKQGSVAIGRSQRHGDRYFLVRWLSSDFVRPGIPGSYRIPDELGARWQQLIMDPLSPPAPPSSS
jgi:hypothetical protein